MKIREGLMLREIAGSWIVVPIGERVVEFNAMIILSKSGAQLWERLQSGADEDDLVQLLKSKYDVDDFTAKADVQEFISSVSERGLFVE